MKQQSIHINTFEILVKLLQSRALLYKSSWQAQRQMTAIYDIAGNRLGAFPWQATCKGNKLVIQKTFRDGKTSTVKVKPFEVE